MARLGGDDGPKAVLYSEHRKRAQSLIFIAVTSTPSHVHKGRLTRDQPHLRLCPDTASSCRRYTLLQPPRRGHIRQPAPGRPGYHLRPEYPPPKRLVASGLTTTCGSGESLRVLPCWLFSCRRHGDCAAPCRPSHWGDVRADLGPANDHWQTPIPRKHAREPMSGTGLGTFTCPNRCIHRDPAQPGSQP